jgi:hypothetical protein
MHGIDLLLSFYRCFRVERHTPNIQTDETCSPTACGHTVSRMGLSPCLRKAVMDVSRVAHCLCPESFGQSRLDESRACHLKHDTIRTLSRWLGRLRCRAVYGYTTVYGKLGNRSILPVVVGVDGLYLRLLTKLELAQKLLKTTQHIGLPLHREYRNIPTVLNESKKSPMPLPLWYDSPFSCHIRDRRVDSVEDA